jgi:hypothetical protein
MAGKPRASLYKPGYKIGRWTLISEAKRVWHGARKWHCKCECGTERDVTESSLQRGRSLSCGCIRQAILDGKKFCRKCKRALPGTDEFFRPRGDGDGLRSRCRECEAAANKNRNWWSGRIFKLFGITADDYRQILDLQGGVCAICKRDCDSGRRLAIDHDHDTGQVRGLLCTKCNMAIGALRESAEALRRAADYLEWHKSNPGTTLVTAA